MEATEIVTRKYARTLRSDDVIWTVRGPLFVYSVEQVHPQIIRVDYNNAEQVDMFGPDNVVEVIELV